MDWDAPDPITAFARFKQKCQLMFSSALKVQCRSKGNISGGGGGTRALEARDGRGSGGMLPQKILKSKGLEMLFPAFSKCYLVFMHCLSKPMHIETSITK